ncbi:MAG: thioredoxin [Candidatus Gottesmanbacteria bacterium]
MIILTDQNFENEVLKADKPVLVDLYADWCGPCQMYGPIIEELAKEMGDKIKVGKMNVDQNQTIPSKYGVMSIPTTLIVNKGQVVKQLVGAQTKETLINDINTLI